MGGQCLLRRKVEESKLSSVDSEVRPVLRQDGLKFTSVYIVYKQINLLAERQRLIVACSKKMRKTYQLAHLPGSLCRLNDFGGRPFFLSDFKRTEAMSAIKQDLMTFGKDCGKEAPVMGCADAGRSVRRFRIDLFWRKPTDP